MQIIMIIYTVIVIMLVTLSIFSVNFYCIIILSMFVNVYFGMFLVFLFEKLL
jgi:hypothetical protein